MAADAGGTGKTARADHTRASSGGKTPHQTSVDRALSALETAAGSGRVLSHLTSAGGEPGAGVALEDLVEAFKRFREREPM